MNNPLFSIIIPVYNTEKYLRQCLDSVLTQTYTNWECLLVDDGSKDSSVAICDEYAQMDSRFKVFHKENGGVSSARNKGLENAKGEYICFIDSDDFVESKYLQTICENTSEKDLLIFSNNLFFEDGCQTFLQLNNVTLNNKIEFEQYIYRLKTVNQQHFEIYGYLWNKCFKSTIIKNNNIRFTEGLSWKEDNVFLEQYYREVNNCQIIKNILYHYRVSSIGLTFHKNSTAEYLLLAESLEKNTNKIDFQKLLVYEKNNIFRFLEIAQNADGSFNYPAYYATRDYFAKYKRFILQNVRRRLLYKAPFFLSFLYLNRFTIIKKLYYLHE